MFSDIEILGMDLYNIFVSLGTYSIIIWNFIHFRHKKSFPSNISKKLSRCIKNSNIKITIENISTVIELLLIILFYYYLAGSYNVWFGKLIHMGPNYFGTALIGPFMLSAICFIIRLDVIKVYDMIAPSYPLGLIFAKIGCFCAGCCRGIECEYGLYNKTSGLTEFPVQLVEIGLALSMFIILLFARKKAKPGTLYPMYLILYSGTRFCSEFLRVEPDILGKLKLYHLCCIAGIIFGIVFLIIALKFADKISYFFTKDYKIDTYLANIIKEINYSYNTLKTRLTKKDKQIIHHKKKKTKKKKKATYKK